jgi:hypothetical protein
MEKDARSMFVLISHHLRETLFAKREAQDWTTSEASYERRFTRGVFC